MEVRFRPLRDSTLARHVTPGQPPVEEGQNFLEVIENVAGAEQAAGENPGSDHGKREKSQLRNRAGSPAVADGMADAAKNPAILSAHEQVSPPQNKTAPEDKPLGAHIDMTA